MKRTAFDIVDVFLFYGMGKDTTLKIIEKYAPNILRFQRGELVMSEEKNCHTVGFVLSGECEVRRGKEGLLLNTLKLGDSFGILSVFLENDNFPTEIFARKNTAVLFFAKEDILSMINLYPEISLNIIKFLSERVGFLNKKIAEFSAGSAADKTAAFLLSEYKKSGDCFSLNCKRASEALGLGRASVYRALDSLENEGIISFVDKKIYIKSPEGLKEKTK